ncbi:MAG: hypothetical protein SOH81_07840 [Acetobacter sp.]
MRGVHAYDLIRPIPADPRDDTEPHTLIALFSAAQVWATIFPNAPVAMRSEIVRNLEEIIMDGRSPQNGISSSMSSQPDD